MSCHYIASNWMWICCYYYMCWMWIGCDYVARWAVTTLLDVGCSRRLPPVCTFSCHLMRSSWCSSLRWRILLSSSTMVASLSFNCWSCCPLHTKHSNFSHSITSNTQCHTFVGAAFNFKTKKKWRHHSPRSVARILKDWLTHPFDNTGLPHPYFKEYYYSFE